jgi:hypothetical protein
LKVDEAKEAPAQSISNDRLPLPIAHFTIFAHAHAHQWLPNKRSAPVNRLRQSLTLQGSPPLNEK